MLHILNRKRILLDTDPQELARVKQRLDLAGIRYGVKTTVSDNVMSRTANASSAKYYNAAYSATQTQTYLYQVFVHRKDYAAAKKAVTQK